MIARIWRGAVSAEDGDTYADYMSRTGVPGYTGTSGNRGVVMLRRRSQDRCEFLMISLWDSMGAIRAFAGDQVDRAVFYPEDERFLVDKDLHVDHYEIVEHEGLPDSVKAAQ